MTGVLADPPAAVRLCERAVAGLPLPGRLAPVTEVSPSVQATLFGIEIVRSGDGMGMGTCRRELLDRILVWSRADLRRACVRGFGVLSDGHRPDQGMVKA